MKRPELVDFAHLGRGDIDLVGAKAANLGELTQAGLAVPRGFVVTGVAHERFLRTSGLVSKIKRLVSTIDPKQPTSIEKNAKAIQHLLVHASLPTDLAKSIDAAYRRLSRTEIAVAVRASLTTDEQMTASLGGSDATFLQVVGLPAIHRAILHVWASLFTPQLINHRLRLGIDHFTFEMAVIVQVMVVAEKSGVFVTTNPLSHNSDEILIEAGLGLGEPIVLGAIEPDRYLVSKADHKILDVTIQSQPWQIVRLGAQANGTKHVSIPKKDQRKQKLTNQEILAVSDIAKQVEEHYHYPQMTEWALDQSGTIWLLETWPAPERTEHVDRQTPVPTVDQAAPILVRGLGACLGLVSGPVRIIHKVSQLNEVKEGEILVTEATSPAFAPAISRARAVVTDTGGLTSHAVLLSRELGRPCVVGTGTATSHLKQGVVVTVDGNRGVVYKGNVSHAVNKQATSQPSATTQSVDNPVTATKVYLNLSDPNQAATAAKLPVDGVGLLRAEFMLAQFGIHPRYLLKEQKEAVLVRALSDNLRTIASAFAPRPVIYRGSDLKTNEYRQLTGGEKVEPKEENPMLGYRGALRYLREPDLFALELQALKTVRESYNLRNVSLMIPFVRTVEELVAVKKQIEATGMLGDPDFKLWMMVEVPSNILMLEQFLAVGLDGVSIGSNDLTQLLLGVDRDNARLASSFDERHPVVMRAMTHVVEVCRRHHVSVSICGNAASSYPEVVETLVSAGITSLSVNPDAAIGTRRLTASIERRMLLDALTKTAHGARHPVW